MVIVPDVLAKVVVFAPAAYVPSDESNVRFPKIVLTVFGNVPLNPVRFKFLYVGVVAVSVRAYVPVVMFTFSAFVSVKPVFSVIVVAVALLFDTLIADVPV